MAIYKGRECLDDDDEVVRYTSKKGLDEDGMPTAVAFMLREDKDGTVEDALSVNSMKIADCSNKSLLPKMKELFADKLNLAPSAALFVMPVGHTVQAHCNLTDPKREIRIIEDPWPYESKQKGEIVTDKSHALVIGEEICNQAMLDGEVLSSCVTRSTRIKDIS